MRQYFKNFKNKQTTFLEKWLYHAQQFWMGCVIILKILLPIALLRLLLINGNKSNSKTLFETLPHDLEIKNGLVPFDQNSLTQTAHLALFDPRLLQSAFLKFDSALVSIFIFPGALAQATPKSATSIQYPLINIGSVNIANVINIVPNKNGTVVYAVGSGGYCFQVINVGDVLHPWLMSSYGETTGNSNHCVALILNQNGTLAFVADNKNGGLIIVNVTNPAAPVFLSSLPGFNAYDVALSNNGQQAFVVSYAQSGPRIFTVNLHDVLRPSLLNTTTFPWFLYIDMQIKPAEGEGIFKIRSKQDGSLVLGYSFWTIRSNTLSPSTRGFETALCIIDSSFIRKRCLYRIGDSANPFSVISQFNVMGDRIIIAVMMTSGDPYYMSGFPLGVTIIDISNSSNPTVIRTYTSTSKNAVVFFPGEKTAIIINTNNGADVLNFDQLDPTDPPVVISKWRADWYNDLQLHPINNQLLFAITNSSFQVLRLQPVLDVPANLLTLKTSLVMSNVINILLTQHGRYGFSGPGPNGNIVYLITIDDITNPTQLQSQEPLATSGYGGSSIALSLDDQRLFIVYSPYSFGCSIVDISDPVYLPKSKRFASRSNVYKEIAPAFHPSNKYIALANETHIQIINASDIQETVSVLPSSSVNHILFNNKNETTLYVARSEGITIINATTIIALEIISTTFFFDVKTMALTSNDQLLLVGYTRGLVIYNVSNSSSPLLLAKLTTPVINKIQITHDNLYAYLACSTGVICVDISKPEAPTIIFNAPTVSNALDLALTPYGFIYTANGDSVNVFSINNNFFSLIENPTLKSSEINTGKILFFLSQLGAEQETRQLIPPIVTIDIVNSDNTLSTAPSWIVFDKTTGEFTITPPDTLIGKTLTLRFGLGSKFSCDAAFPAIVPGVAVVLTPVPTNVPTAVPTAIPTPLPTNAPTNMTTTSIPSNISTALPTNAPTNAPTNIPTSAPITHAPTTIPTTARQVVTLPPDVTTLSNQTLSPEETIAPASLQFNITSTIQVISANTAKQITLLITGVLPEIGSFMFGTAGLGSAVTKYDSISGNLEITANNVLALNQFLANVRVSPNVDNPAYNVSTYNQTAISLYVSDNSLDGWIRGSATLAQLGTNHAPDITGNSTLFNTQTNQTVPLNGPFRVDFNKVVKDPDGDTWTVIVTAPDSFSSQLPLGGQVRNNVLAGTCFEPGEKKYVAVVRDKYLQARPIDITIVCEYIALSVKQSIDNINIKVGAGFTTLLPLAAIFTGGAAPFSYSAKLLNGLPLASAGLAFDPITGQLSGLVNQDRIVNITVIAQDLFGYTAETTFKLTAFDSAPTVANAIPSQIAKPGKTFSFKIPPHTFIDADDATFTYSMMQGSGAPLPPWINFDPDSKQILATPTVNELGKNFIFRIRASDGYKFVDMNVTLFVPPNQPPFIQKRLQNVTATADNQMTYKIPSDAFNSTEFSGLMTYLANLFNETGKGNLPIPDWIKLDEDTLTGTPTMDDLGNVCIKITAVDPLGDKAAQVFCIKIEAPLWKEIWKHVQYWGLRVGVPVSALLTVYGIYEYYEKRAIIANTLTGKRYQLKGEKACFKACSDGHYELTVKCKHKDPLYPEYLQRVKTNKLDPLNRVIATFVKPFSVYFYGRQTLMPVENPDWIRWDDFTRTLIVYPENIPRHPETITVQLRKLSGRIEWEVEINPKDFLDAMNRSDHFEVVMQQEEQKYSSHLLELAEATEELEQPLLTTIPPVDTDIPPPPPPPPKEPCSSTIANTGRDLLPASAVTSNFADHHQFQSLQSRINSKPKPQSDFFSVQPPSQSPSDSLNGSPLGSPVGSPLSSPLSSIERTFQQLPQLNNPNPNSTPGKKSPPPSPKPKLKKLPLPSSRSGSQQSPSLSSLGDAAVLEDFVSKMSNPGKPRFLPPPQNTKKSPPPAQSSLANCL